VVTATEEVLGRAKDLAAASLEASVDDIVVQSDGRVGVAGGPSRAVSWAGLAALAGTEGWAGRGGLGGGPDLNDQRAAGQPGGANPGARSEDDDGLGPLAAAVDFTQEGATFPFGAHVSVVEVDMETGEVDPIRHVAVDDCGRIVNPLLVTG